MLRVASKEAVVEVARYVVLDLLMSRIEERPICAGRPMRLGVILTLKSAECSVMPFGCVPPFTIASRRRLCHVIAWRIERRTE